MLAPGWHGLPWLRDLGATVFVWEGRSRREVASELDVKRDPPLALAGRAADEVARLEFGVGGELEAAEAASRRITPSRTEERSRYWTAHQPAASRDG